MSHSFPPPLSRFEGAPTGPSPLPPPPPIRTQSDSSIRPKLLTRSRWTEGLIGLFGCGGGGEGKDGRMAATKAGSGAGRAASGRVRSKKHLISIYSFCGDPVRFDGVQSQFCPPTPRRHRWRKSWVLHEQGVRWVGHEPGHRLHGS
ncbi:hypothetical protein LX32DRAFT_1631 [Colletotrichum zoysiae]|uniref:Uncharacterized protein n=1 Tax=Colletotrichum zoysiae TaxID=1216348 RepID=A0AAD9M9P2_9PEZI|nr:hypothetical protein LX32DRAFT_1631 [Colletotrichum zoysiae]